MRGGGGRRRRIVQLINQRQGGGAEILVNQLEKWLNDHDYPVEVVTLRSLSASARRGFAAQIENGLGAWHAIWSIFGWARRGPVVVHAHLCPALYIAAIMSFLGVPIVATEHNTNYRRRRWWIFRALDRIAYQRCHSVICISEGVAKALSNQYPQIRKKLIIVPNGINLQRFHPCERGRSEVTAGMICRFTEQKNILRMLDAVQQCSQCLNRFVLVGDGEMRFEILQRITDLGIQNLVEVRPFTDRPEDVYRDIDIFCIPSLWEGFGLTAVEAMASGCAVLASNVEGLSEILTGASGVTNAMLVDPLSVSSIADGLRRLATDTSLRTTLQRKGPSCSEEYSFDRMASDYLRIYGSVTP